jgi:plastocyanin
MPASTRRLIVFVLCALTLAACGGSSAAVREPSRDFKVTLDDYLIRPQNLSVPRGALTITVTNRGRLGHTLRIRTAKSARNVLAFTTLEPGESKTRSFKLSRGTYTMYCVLANHEELGMHGTLVVR